MKSRYWILAAAFVILFVYVQFSSVTAADGDTVEARTVLGGDETTPDRTPPEIVSIRIEKVDDNSTLNLLPFGIYGNGSVTVAVEAVGETFEQDTTIYLGDGEVYESKAGNPMLCEEGIYHYMAVFTYDVFKNADQLNAYAVNDSGTGSVSAEITGVSDTDNSDKTIETQPFLLENLEPEISVDTMDSNRIQISCGVSVSDRDAGIARVEYGWDLDRDLCDDKKNMDTGHYLGFAQNGYTDQYVDYYFDNSQMVHELSLILELLYEDSVWAVDDRHTLYIRVTDNAGNVKDFRLQDSIGNDMLAPNITGIEIRKIDTSSPDSVLRFLPFGTFSNGSVEIAVTADDNESEKGVHISGIHTVVINDRTMTKNDEGEYVLTISSEDMLSAMSVTVEDNAGWATTATVTDITPDANLLKSADLIVENNAPVISWDFSVQGHIDPDGRLWYGREEARDFVEISVSDNQGTVSSGLYTVRITDNNDIIFEKSEYLSLELEHFETFILGALSEGSHEIVVMAEDNAGNVTVDTRTFYIDSILPSGGAVSVTDPDGLVVDGRLWFDRDETVAFRVNCSDGDSGLKNVVVKINERSLLFEENDILTDEEGQYVVFDTTGLEADKKHQYTITGIITDWAGNELDIEPFTVYKDLEVPHVRRLTVGKKNPSSEKSLNMLNYGIYSNDTLVIKAYASDVEFDVGVDYVTVFYEGLFAPEFMTNEGGGVFSAEINSGQEAAEYHISVTAYDRFGKSSEISPKLEVAETGDVAGDNYVMVDMIEPSVDFRLITDSEADTNEPMWFNSAQDMELKIQDVNSGIRNVEFYVNGVKIVCDKNGVILLRSTDTEIAAQRNTEEHLYVFDTDYLTGITGEPEDGKYSIYIKVSDNAGNISVYEMEYYIDIIPPQIDRVAFAPSTSDGIQDTGEFIEGLDYGLFFTSNFTATVYTSDALPSCGLDKVKYRLVSYPDDTAQEETTGVLKITEGIVEIPVPQDFKGQLFVEAFDNLGNHSGEVTTRAYVVDHNAPEISIVNNVLTPYVDGEGNPLYVTDNSITVEITDMVSGLREIGYSQSAEQDSYDRVNITLNQDYYYVGEDLGNEWIVSQVDRNLVTKVTKTFVFNNDDNDVVLTFDATDNALNALRNVNSDKFTVDKTNPVINVVFRPDEGINGYYSQNRIADITVIERNFDEKAIEVTIENMFGVVPSCSFLEQSKMEHTAVVNFDEGDYIFDISGMDRGEHEAVVSFSGGDERFFFVDKTSPVIVEDFELLVNADTENSFNYDKTIRIQITEHNFDSALTQLRIFRKNAGEDHDVGGFVDVTYGVLQDVDWSSIGDIHTIVFTVSEDAVYQVELTPADLAGNYAERRNSAVFEIDKTAPVVTAKNGRPVSADSTELVDIYSYLRANEPTPSVEFEDLNIDHINYALTVYIPDHTSPEADTVIRPKQVYIEEDVGKTGTVMAGRFVMPELVEDGVYALELTAVDVAGNESLLNVNTYARMVDQDVLAYIMKSNAAQASGLYSFQYENGTAISKRPDDFEDIEICVLAKEDTEVAIVLRDSNGNETVTNAQASIKSNIYGMNIYDFTLSASFFKENFQDDTDAQLILTVRNQDNRIDLGKMHIDNIAPTCDIPEDFRSWHWYYGEDTHIITISNISEPMDEDRCKVYDNGREVAFTYFREENSIEFTLEKGWHNVGIVLSDVAGNTYNIQEQSNIYIGFFWLWMIVAGSASVALLSVCVIIRGTRKRRVNESGE